MEIKLKDTIRRWRNSIWFFPVLLLLPLLLLTIFKISGTSTGVYNNILYSGTRDDSSLLLFKAREVRSDEWVVNTPMTIAQDRAGYAQVNPHIGNGQDMSVVLDVPYADWSTLFRPQNWSFFVLPFEYAFAFKWWLLAYLLVVSCYLFILALLPGRRMLAAVLSLSLLFGAMIQWWYQTITLAPLYYSLFMAVAVIYLVRAKRLLHTVLWGGLLAYLVASFILILYPPFQIAAGLALSAFIVGYLVRVWRGKPRAEILPKLAVMGGAVAAAGAVVWLFIQTRAPVISAITQSDYPGDRVISSGGFDPVHLFSGHLNFMLQSTSHAKQYLFEFAGNLVPLNQSEASNFVLLLPFLFLPGMYILYLDYRAKRKPDWPLIAVNIGFVFFMIWLFVPSVPIFGKLFLLEKVQLIRLLLGLGLLNIFQFVLLARRLPELKGRLFSQKYVFGYALLVFLVQLWLGWIVLSRSPGYIELYQVIILSLPVPLIVYFLLRKKILLAALGVLAFALFSSGLVNPLERGLAPATQTPLSQAIQRIESKQPGIWATDVIWLGSFPTLNGARTITGVYTYPQLDVWRSIDAGDEQSTYNRYSHVTIEFDRESDKTIETKLELIRADHFTVHTEPCSAFVREKQIRYIFTTKEITDPCLQQIETVEYPYIKVFIYEVQG